MLSNQKFDSEIHELYTRMWKKEKRGFCLLITLDGVREKELETKKQKKNRNKETDKKKVEEKTAQLSVGKKMEAKRQRERKKMDEKNCTMHKYRVDQKKVRAELFICFIVDVYCCFIQAPNINNDWKSDFWNVRCLLYQVESIMTNFKKPENFLLKNSHEMQLKRSKFCNV